MMEVGTRRYTKGGKRGFSGRREGLRSGCRLVNIAASVKMFESAEFERGGFLGEKCRSLMENNTVRVLGLSRNLSGRYEV